MRNDERQIRRWLASVSLCAMKLTAKQAGNKRAKVFYFRMLDSLRYPSRRMQVEIGLRQQMSQSAACCCCTAKVSLV